jgi:hypothetical protein
MRGIRDENLEHMEKLGQRSTTNSKVDWELILGAGGVVSVLLKKGKNQKKKKETQVGWSKPESNGCSCFTSDSVDFDYVAQVRTAPLWTGIGGRVGPACISPAHTYN